MLTSPCQQDHILSILFRGFDSSMIAQKKSHSFLTVMIAARSEAHLSFWRSENNVFVQISKFEFRNRYRNALTLFPNNNQQWWSCSSPSLFHHRNEESKNHYQEVEGKNSSRTGAPAWKHGFYWYRRAMDAEMMLEEIDGSTTNEDEEDGENE